MWAYTFLGIVILNVFSQVDSAPVSSTYEGITDQLFQIVRGIITEQQAFEASVTAQLDNIKTSQSLLVARMGESAALKQATGEFYPKKVTLYQGLLHGHAWDVQLPTNPTTCENVPTQALNKVSSIDTNGNCIILFKGRNCAGRGLRFSDYTYGYDDFGRINFHDHVTSFRSC